jgi:hypothetical protein
MPISGFLRKRQKVEAGGGRRFSFANVSVRSTDSLSVHSVATLEDVCELRRDPAPEQRSDSGALDRGLLLCAHNGEALEKATLLRTVLNRVARFLLVQHTKMS